MTRIKRFEEFIQENHEFLKTTDKDVQQFLDTLNNTELENLWIDYSSICKAATYDNPLTILMFDINNPYVNEGLISTYPIDRTVSYIANYFNLARNQISKVKASNDIYHILVIIPNRDNNLELMKRAMQFCGYYLGHPKEASLPKNQFVKLQFEPKVQKDCSKSIRATESVLLHLTPYHNLGKIRHIGFSPRCKNELFDYPSRIYFLKGSIIPQEINAIGSRLSKVNNSPGNTGRYALITIDIAKIPSHVKMYPDPNYPHGIFVTENISPDVISSVREITFP